MREIRTEIDITAQPEKVWSILTDASHYPEWNPFITSAEDGFAVGRKIRIHCEPPNGRPMSFHPICLERNENQTLRWRGSLGIRGLFDGEHIFELESVGESKTRFVQREKFSGILVPLVWSSMAANTRKGFEMMNQKLKERAERNSR